MVIDEVIIPIPEFYKKTLESLNNLTDPFATEAFESQLIVDLTNSSKKIFNNIVEYLISGNCFKTLNKDREFICKHLELVKGFSKKEIVNSSLNDDNPNFGLIYDFTYTVEYWLNILDNYLQEVHNKITEHNPELFVFQTNNSSKDVKILNTYTSEIEDIINFTSLDFKWSSNPTNKLNFLFELKSKLNNKSQYFKDLNPKSKSILIAKIDLLTSKIENCYNRSYRLLYNGTEDISRTNDGPFKDYLVDFTKPAVIEKATKQYRYNCNQSEFKFFYVKIKHIKDHPDFSSKIIGLIAQFDDLINENNYFDEWAHKISRNYIYNKYLESKINNENITFTELDKIFEEITLEQTKNEVEDFYPFFKIAYRSYNIAKNNKTISTSELTILISFLRKVIMKIETNIVWSKSHLHWAYQPSYEECCKNIEDTNVFTPYAYNTPIDYNKFDYEISLIKNKTDILEERLEMLNIKDLIVKSTNEEIRKETKSVLNKNVEILSVFAAIVLFTSGNIQLYKEVNNINQALLFMLTFAYIICVFVLLIRIITKENDKISKLEKKIIQIISIATLIIVSYLIIDDVYQHNLGTQHTVTKTETTTNSNLLRNNKIYKNQKTSETKTVITPTALK